MNNQQFIVYSILRVFVILTAVRCAFTHNFESLAICILSLALFLLPSLFEELLKVEIPPIFEIIIYLYEARHKTKSLAKEINKMQLV